MCSRAGENSELSPAENEFKVGRYGTVSIGALPKKTINPNQTV